MDTTGCPPQYAQDDLLSLGHDPQQPQDDLAPTSHHASGDCTLDIVAFTACFVLFIVVTAMVAILRTHLVVRNRRRRSQTLCSSRSWMSLLVLFQSWATAGVYLSILIVVYVNGGKNNLVVILVGLELLLYGVGVDQWTSKLIRLGTRIIGPAKNRISTNLRKTGATDSPVIKRSRPSLLPRPSVVMSSTMNFKEKADPDKLLKLLITIGRLLLVIQLVVLCVLCPVFDQQIWLQVGLALQAAIVLVYMCTMLWQYHRCETAMTQTQKRIQQVKSTVNPKKLDTVRMKFRIHRVILLANGIPAVVMLILWASGAYPINYITVITMGVFDVVINGFMLATFVFGGRPRKDRKNIAMAAVPLTFDMASSPPTREFRELAPYTRESGGSNT